MRKYIYSILIFALLLPTIAQAGNVKTGAQLVQELCNQARYAFCGSSFSTNRRTSQYGYVTANDAGTVVRKPTYPGSGSGSTQWYKIERLSRTTARITDLKTGRRVDLYGPLNRWNTAWLNGAKVQVAHLLWGNSNYLTVAVYCPSGTRVVPTGGTAVSHGWYYYASSNPSKTLGCD